MSRPRRSNGFLSIAAPPFMPRPPASGSAPLRWHSTGYARGTLASFAQVYRLIARFRRHPVSLSLVVTKSGPKKGVRLLPGEIELRIEEAIDTVFKQRERPTPGEAAARYPQGPRRSGIEAAVTQGGPGARIGPLAERDGESARRHEGGTAEICSRWSRPAAVPAVGDRVDRSHQDGS